MAIRYRPMRPRDVRECVQIIARHPIISPRYGTAIADLHSVWLKILGREACRALVFEESVGSQMRVIGCGVSVFVSNDFMVEVKKPPFFWAAPELVNRVMNGNSPLLSDKEVREANSDGGLNLLVWEGTIRMEDFSRPDVLHAIFAAFIEQHRGFLLNELMSHSVTLETLKGMVHSGGLFLSPDGSYVDRLEQPLSEVLAKPHYFGLTRDLAQQRFGTWIGSLFTYQPPRFGFRPSEQRLLLAALRGGTDEDLSDELAVSISAIKKTWTAIYDRVRAHDSNLMPLTDHSDGAERGKGKKQLLLGYLRDHPEELRPAAL